MGDSNMAKESPERDIGRLHRVMAALDYLGAESSTDAGTEAQARGRAAAILDAYVDADDLQANANPLPVTTQAHTRHSTQASGAAANGSISAVAAQQPVPVSSQTASAVISMEAPLNEDVKAQAPAASTSETHEGQVPQEAPTQAQEDGVEEAQKVAPLLKRPLNPFQLLEAMH